MPLIIFSQLLDGLIEPGWVHDSTVDDRKAEY